MVSNKKIHRALRTNSYEQYPLETFFIFTIYQNYTLALKVLYFWEYKFMFYWVHNNSMILF